MYSTAFILFIIGGYCASAHWEEFAEWVHAGRPKDVFEAADLEWVETKCEELEVRHWIVDPHILGKRDGEMKMNACFDSLMWGYGYGVFEEATSRKVLQKLRREYLAKGLEKFEDVMKSQKANSPQLEVSFINLIFN